MNEMRLPQAASSLYLSHYQLIIVPRLARGKDELSIIRDTAKQKLFSRNCPRIYWNLR